MDMFHIGSQVGFNIVIATFLYVALLHEIGQVRKDIRRLAKGKRLPGPPRCCWFRCCGPQLTTEP